MQGDPVGEWPWCNHSAEDHRKDTSDRIESARLTFRKLAVFDVDAKQSAVAQLNWEKNRYLLSAADIIDELYWRQAWPQSSYQSLLEEAGEDEELKEMLSFNRGPYDRFDKNKPFFDVDPEPPGRGFYPTDLKREEFTKYVDSHQDLRAVLESPYTLIKREDVRLAGVSYHDAYRDLIERVSKLLKQASALERHVGFANYLAQRASDLLTDDYYASELLWVQLEDNPVDLVIGTLRSL